MKTWRRTYWDSSHNTIVRSVLQFGPRDSEALLIERTLNSDRKTLTCSALGMEKRTLEARDWDTAEREAFDLVYLRTRVMFEALHKIREARR